MSFRKSFLIKDILFDPISLSSTVVHRCLDCRRQTTTTTSQTNLHTYHSSASQLTTDPTRPIHQNNPRWSTDHTLYGLYCAAVAATGHPNPHANQHPHPHPHTHHHNIGDSICGESGGQSGGGVGVGVGGVSVGSGGRKARRNRTVFTELQLMGLERRFDSQKYLSTPDRAELARALGLTQLQVKTWYQNRRMKWKKQVMLTGCPVPPTKPKGRPKKNSIPSLGLLDTVLVVSNGSNGQQQQQIIQF